MAPITSSRSLDPKVAHALHALYHLSNEQRRAVLKIAKKPLIKSICECALNTLKGRITLSPLQKSKLIKHKHTLRKLINAKSGSWQSKKRIILQKGSGFLTALLAPLLGTVLSTIISNRKQ